MKETMKQKDMKRVKTKVDYGAKMTQQERVFGDTRVTPRPL